MGFIFLLIGTPIALILFTSIGEHYVSNPRVFRWSMVLGSAVIATLLLTIMSEGENWLGGIAVGMAIYAMVYILGTLFPFVRPGLRDALKYPDQR